MLGSDLKSPVNMVVCWTPRGEATGGTGQAIRMARHYGIPVYNLYDPQSITQLSKILENT
jgi:hypothetical protein